MTDETTPTPTPTPTPASDPAATGGQSTGPDRDFLEYVVRALVDSPDEVVITRTVDDLGVLITLRVNKSDMSKIIGKSGQTARSLRTLLRVVGSKHDLRVNLKVLEPDGSEYRSRENEEPRSGFGAKRPVRQAPSTKPAPATENTKEQPDQDGASAFDNII